MFDHLDIYTPSERWLVGLADAALSVAVWPVKTLSRRRARQLPSRVLLLRLERIGDLLMTLGAIRAVRATLPDAEIDLVVGSWNEPLARLIPGITRIETLDAPWLARGSGGTAAATLVQRAIDWRQRRYDLAINFEGDIRSHALMALGAARRRVGHGHAGGGPLLTDVVGHDSRRHVADNALALVERAVDLPAGTLPGPHVTERDWRLPVPDDARRGARAMLAQLSGRLDGPYIAVHVPGGRLVKQWPVERFSEAAAMLAGDLGGSVVLTGGPGDDAIVTDAEHQLRARGVSVLRVQGAADLVMLAATLEQSKLLLTGDTGPMHLAAAVGTPVLAVFGPSMAWRYGPLVSAHRVVRVDLACSPCNRIRRPPERCQGRIPDCLMAVGVAEVVEAGRALLGTRSVTVPSR